MRTKEETRNRFGHVATTSTKCVYERYGSGTCLLGAHVWTATDRSKRKTRRGDRAYITEHRDLECRCRSSVTESTILPKAVRAFKGGN